MHLLLLAIVGNGLARCVDAAGNGGFGNETAVPDGFKQFISRNDTLPIGDEMDQQIEHAGLNGDRSAGLREFAHAGIDDKSRERIACPGHLV